MEERVITTNTLKAVTQTGIIIILLHLTALHSFILFHFIAEFFSIIIAFGIFALVWNSRYYLGNNYLLFIGIALFFVGTIDFIHTLSYGSINLFTNYGIGLSSQLWLAARFLGSISFLIAPLFIKRKLKPNLTFFIYLIITTALLLTIFGHFFPTTFIEGEGLTPFKIYSEYIIASIFFLAALHLYKYRKVFDTRVYLLLTYALLARIIMELVFTMYNDVYDAANQVGHIIKVVAFYLSYLAIIETGLMKPYQVLFKNLKDSEQALRSSEARYRGLYGAIASGVVAQDRRGNIIEANTTAREILGLSLNQIQGRTSLDSRWQAIHEDGSSFPGEDHPSMVTLRTGQPVRGTVMGVFNPGDNKYRWLVINAEPIIDPKTSQVQSVVTTFLDITKRKKAEEELKLYTKRLEILTNDLFKFQLAVEDASDHIVITDPTGKIIYANKAAEEITGYSGRGMIDKTPSLWGNWLLSKTPVETEIKQSAWDLITPKSPSFNGEVKNIRKNGEEYIADLHIAPVLDSKNEIKFFIAIERDITKLKEIDRAKTEFVSLASHQLRTPLTSISLLAELMLRGISGPVDENQKEFLTEIHEATKRMSELIGALLNVSRLELGTFIVKEETINLVESVKKILDELDAQIKAKHISLKQKYSDHIPAINFDENVLRIIIENLVTNAIRYTPDGGEIMLELVEQPTEITIKIADTGCGIPIIDQDKIFTKLYRADNAKAVCSEGTGLGLYIVKSVAEKVGTKIWFESTENVGTSFFVSIPLRK